MKLFLSPGSCALGTLILLEEIGQPFEVGLLNMREGEHMKPPFIKINPKGKVPTLLRDDGSVLTEYLAIALWIAKSFPDKKLIASDLEGEVRMIEMLNFIASDVHKAGFTNIIVPHKISANEDTQNDIRKFGRQNAVKGLALMSDALGEKEFFFDRLSIVDPTAFYVCCWAKAFGVKLPDNIERFYSGMASRPTVQRALDVWTPKGP